MAVLDIFRIDTCIDQHPSLCRRVSCVIVSIRHDHQIAATARCYAIIGSVQNADNHCRPVFAIRHHIMYDSSFC